MPAETWIDFEKDILYLSLDFCYVALEGLVKNYRIQRFHTGRKEPHGYFLKELSQDIQKVNNLAISGLWSPGSNICWGVLADISVIAKPFVDLGRFTLVDAQHTLDLTADLAFVDEFLHSFAGAQLRGPNFQDLMEYRKRLLDYSAGLYEVGHSDDMRVWAGLKPYPWFELGILVERQ
jgi:hypothetical protein